MNEPGAVALPEMAKLPGGHHDIPAELVEESQRRRLMTAAVELLATRGYGRIATTEVAKRARVSTAALYKCFDDLWACLLAAYEADAELLCERIEGSYAAASGEPRERGRAAIASALALLASEPAIANLLCGEPPLQAPALRAARGRLVARLVSMLGRVRGDDEAGSWRLVGGTLALVASQARAGGGEGLEDLAPILAGILLAE